jgi:hypothetical protein
MILYRIFIQDQTVLLTDDEDVAINYLYLYLYLYIYCLYVLSFDLRGCVNILESLESGVVLKVLVGLETPDVYFF